MMVRTVSMCLGLIGALVLSSGLRVGAASRLTEDFADLVKRAAIVVEVEIGANQDEANAQVGMPLTVSSAKVLRVLRGDVSKAIEIERFGGKQGDALLVVPGQATLSTGDRAYVLLIPSPLNNGRYRVLGGDAGCVLSEDANGERMTRRAVGRFDYYVADESSQTGFVARQAVALPDDEFNALASALITTGRPVLTASAVPTPAQDLSPQTAMLSVVSVNTASPIPAPADVPLYFKFGVFLACVTLAWAATRLTRALTK